MARVRQVRPLLLATSPVIPHSWSALSMPTRKLAHFRCCAGFRTPAATSYPRAPEAGVRKAPRHEIAGGRPRSAVLLAQLWGFKRRTCRVRASERREVD